MFIEIRDYIIDHLREMKRHAEATEHDLIEHIIDEVAALPPPPQKHVDDVDDELVMRMLGYLSAQPCCCATNGFQMRCVACRAKDASRKLDLKAMQRREVRSGQLP